MTDKESELSEPKVPAEREINDETSPLAENDSAKFPEGGARAWLVVLAAWLVLLCDFGLLNSTGAIQSWIEPHILIHNTTTQISWIFSIYCFLTFGGTMISGPIFDRYGAKTVLIFGTVMLVGGLFATASCTKLYQFILSFSVCCGLGCSFMTSPCVGCIGHYFNKRRGLAMGVAMSGASLGGVVWPLLCRGLYTKIGYVWTIRTLAFIFLGLMIVAIAIANDRCRVFRPELYENRGVRGMSKGKYILQEFMSQLKEIMDFSLLKNRTYAWLVLALIMNEFSLVLTFTYLPYYSMNSGYSQSTALLLLMVLNAVGIPGRYLPAMLSSRFGEYTMITLCSLVMTVSLFAIWAPFGKYLGAEYAFSCLYGFAVAGTLSLTPLCTSKIVAPKDVGKAYGQAYAFASVANLFSLPIGTAITTSKGGYEAMAWFCGATCAVGTVFFTLSRIKLGGLSWKAV